MAAGGMPPLQQGSLRAVQCRVLKIVTRNCTHIIGDSVSDSTPVCVAL